MRVFVESWAPEYGGPVDLAEELAPEEVDVSVETGDWRPLEGGGELPGWVAFVDGVRRVDARLIVEHPEAGPVPGICGSCAAGSVVWDAARRRSEIRDAVVRRLAIVGEGLRVALPAAGSLVYESESFPSRDTGALVQQLQTRMRQVEGELARTLADEGLFVVSDGPIQPLTPHAVVGFIKRQLAPYLRAEQARVVGALAVGQRTPLFRFGARYPRYSWYLRLADLPGGHAWSGVARCECTATLSLEQARQLADISALLLPRFASAEHIDPRAPQNLVPVGAFLRRMQAAVMRVGHLVRAGKSRRIDRGRAQVTVVAIQSLHDLAQRFVVGALLEETFGQKEASGQRLPLSVIVLDELNKYAPREGQSPLKEMLIDIAQRGRSLGVLLVGAQQTASRVAPEVMENASIRVAGRLDAAEAQRAEYGWMLPATRARARLLKPGTMVLSQPAIPVPLVVTFPFPPWATRREEVADGRDPFEGL